MRWTLAIPITTAVACLPPERTPIRTPDGGEVVLSCDLVYAQGDVGQGCTFVPEEWPVRRPEYVELRGEVVPVGCKVRLPVKVEGTKQEVTCTTLWKAGRWLYGWRGGVTSRDVVTEEFVARP